MTPHIPCLVLWAIVAVPFMVAAWAAWESVK